MVVSKALVAKIDRPMGIVSFQVAKDSNDILNSWAMNLEKLLDLVEKSCHQIHKETMVHKAALKAVMDLRTVVYFWHMLYHWQGPNGLCL
ncbi:26S PROTEASOME NON-ATPASE REGULATORY SUBUNIT 12/COP9 SIGNALOSOME COMPLEX SUBUNIT 4 [Salix koriyanagi]|nr:26S PROTEASOME NON-ATPASE REGULATORY SUBUNIT 12/COP9 SIGNALOSOME COMPLEX SUBUNIT 4 [Salix koriyanagi]